MKCNETVGKWCKNKHGASKIIDTLETYQGVWVIHITQPGRETEPKTEKIKFKTFHTNKKMGAHLLMQELIAGLCG
jgi:hypothetical protein